VPLLPPAISTRPSSSVVAEACAGASWSWPATLEKARLTKIVGR
jgi:hypothetical protein